jgi:iron(II)-dependent oxidoreductase
MAMVPNTRAQLGCSHDWRNAPGPTPVQLIEWVREARQRTFELIADLTDDQLIGPQLPILNPLLWEIGHVAWFQEKWVLRQVSGADPIQPDSDALYDSAAVAHDSRWNLPLPGRLQTLRYSEEVRDRVLDRLARGTPSKDDVYFTLLSVFHEDMHTEAFTYTRQTLGYRAPALSGIVTSPSPLAPLPTPHSSLQHSSGDVYVPGGRFELGAVPDESFVFDNEKWAHRVEVPPFCMARTPVTQDQFAAFVDDGGYRTSRLWSKVGWDWRQMAGADHPLYWQREAASRRLRREFDRWVPLEAARPMLHVNWYEAEAYCAWAGRRLPREWEWELAAAADSVENALLPHKRSFPWGDALPTPELAHLDWNTMGTIDVDALPAGDSVFGCRQMIGNVWEWTADDFLPYPGFTVDPYKEYSAPWFGNHKVLRGGCWATRSRLIRNTWRNFYRPDRRDVWAGFRTCALEP